MRKNLVVKIMMSLAVLFAIASCGDDGEIDVNTECTTVQDTSKVYIPRTVGNYYLTNDLNRKFIVSDKTIYYNNEGANVYLNRIYSLNVETGDTLFGEDKYIGENETHLFFKSGIASYSTSEIPKGTFIKGATWNNGILAGIGGTPGTIAIGYEVLDADIDYTFGGITYSKVVVIEKTTTVNNASNGGAGSVSKETIRFAKGIGFLINFYDGYKCFYIQ
jgi:hypothetical protein